MIRQNVLSLTATGLIGLATSESFGIANAQDTGKNVISTLTGPKPLGPYSQVIQSARPYTSLGSSQPIRRPI